MRTVRVSCELNEEESCWFIRVEIDGKPHFFTAPDTADIAQEIRCDIVQAMKQIDPDAD